MFARQGLSSVSKSHDPTNHDHKLKISKISSPDLDEPNRWSHATGLVSDDPWVSNAPFFMSLFQAALRSIRAECLVPTPGTASQISVFGIRSGTHDRNPSLRSAAFFEPRNTGWTERSRNLEDEKAGDPRTSFAI